MIFPVSMFSFIFVSKSDCHWCVDITPLPSAATIFPSRQPKRREPINAHKSYDLCECYVHSDWYRRASCCFLACGWRFLLLEIEPMIFVVVVVKHRHKIKSLNSNGFGGFLFCIWKKEMKIERNQSSIVPVEFNATIVNVGNSSANAI